MKNKKKYIHDTNMERKQKHKMTKNKTVNKFISKTEAALTSAYQYARNNYIQVP